MLENKKGPGEFEKLLMIVVKRLTDSVQELVLSWIVEAASGFL